MKRSLPHHSLHRPDRAQQPNGQIERMDRLRNHHTAAIALIAATARRIIIALRPPPRHAQINRANITQIPSFEGCLQGLAGLSGPVLQHDREWNARLRADMHKITGGLEIAFNRFLHQDRFARGRKQLHTVAPRIGGRGQNNKVNCRILRNLLHRIKGACRMARSKIGSLGWIAAQNTAQMQLWSAFDRMNMRGGDHPQTYQCNIHRPPCLALILTHCAAKMQAAI